MIFSKQFKCAVFATLSFEEILYTIREICCKEFDFFSNNLSVYASCAFQEKRTNYYVYISNSLIFIC